MAEIGGKLVLTPTQIRLLQERTAGSGPRPLVVALELDGAVDSERLDQAWQELQRRHPFLRLRLDSSGPYASDQVRALVRGDIPGARVTFQEDLAKVLAMAGRPRDFAVEGPAESVLIRTGPEASTLICSIDHLAIDGWSFGLLAREWSALYCLKPLPPPIDPIPVLKKYIEKQQNSLFDREINELLNEFDGAQPFSVQHSKSEWAFQQIDLPREVASETRRSAAKRRSTPFAFGLAALGRALSIDHGAEDLIVSTHVANRSIPQSDHVACAAYNTIPIRLSAPDNGHNIECWAIRASEASLRALRRQHVPLAIVRRALAPCIPGEAFSRLMINVDEHPFLGFVLPGVIVTEANIGTQKRLGEGLNTPIFSVSSRPWPAGITVSFRETWESLQVYVHYGHELGHRAATMLLGRTIEGLALLTDSNHN